MQLEAVVRCVRRVVTGDPTARVLVFSTWNDVLLLLSHAFQLNGIAFLKPPPGRGLGPALAAFQRPGDGYDGPRVLLLAVGHAGNGLNLTTAQHIVLVEPLNSPGLEAQALGRVDRVGQTRDTHVHRFVIMGTVEHNLHRLNEARALNSRAQVTALSKHLLLSQVVELLETPSRPQAVALDPPSPRR